MYTVVITLQEHDVQGEVNLSPSKKYHLQEKKVSASSAGPVGRSREVEGLASWWDILNPLELEELSRVLLEGLVSASTQNVYNVM